ncbi:RNA polymerase sigma factor [Pelagicoccus mobilis]|uniref:RNA polymerase sigma factor n=1 Tax=Pelagicoccus mobilis TaxID=415221 RepID=A0A934RZW9_9BACT|nr:RNA polymerase sigma factor [Pelagicoccus mobilis]MBK1876909.1 RNA polymerase sigma factor [Pelagicoccus mobilis]
MDTVDDNRLMTAVRDGDLDGIGVLFERYHAPLVGYFRRMCGSSELSEDLAQETFWRILRYRRTYDASRPFRAWMYQIARNLMYDHAKKQKSANRVFDDRVEVDSESFAQPDCDVGREVERADSKELLKQALAKLPLEKRELIVMCRFEEMPYAEIAPMFNCSVGTLKVRLFRALQDLKIVFEELGGKQIA